MSRIIIPICLILFSISFLEAQTFNFDDLHQWKNSGETFSKVVENSTNNATGDNSVVQDKLPVGKKMVAGDRIWSPSKSHYAILQEDGNLCIYTKADAWVWCNMITGAGNYLILQEDGNMCVYTQNKQWRWDTKTHTANPKPVSLIIDDKGVLHLMDSNNKSVWRNQ